MTAECVVTSGRGNFICGEPAQASTAGCIHEHVSDAPICNDHRRAVERGDVACVPCYEGPDPHECRLLAASEARAAR